MGTLIIASALRSSTDEERAGRDRETEKEKAIGTERERH